MIVVSGGSGFIGSNVVSALKKLGKETVICIDDEDKCVDTVWERDHVFDYREAFSGAYEGGFLECITPPEFVIHLGAVTSTTATDEREVLDKNVSFSTRLWDWCTREKVPLIYASSAAVYGRGLGAFTETSPLDPQSLYARSKAVCDFRFGSSDYFGFAPPHWFGLRFFNVYGPGEEHKGEQTSFAYKAWKTIKAGQKVRLFDVKPWPQRDFIHVDDCVDLMLWFMEHKPQSGIYNVGTGKAESFSTVLMHALNAMGEKVSDNLLSSMPHELIEMPDNIGASYQHWTQAHLVKLGNAGYDKPFRSLEEGIRDYVRVLEATSSSRRHK